MLYDFIYITILKWQNDTSGKWASECHNSQFPKHNSKEVDFVRKATWRFEVPCGDGTVPSAWLDLQKSQMWQNHFEFNTHTLEHK